VHRLDGRKSLSKRLPLLISGLLIAALAAFAFVGYKQLTSALTAAANNRAQSASKLLARTFDTQLPQLRAALSGTASDSAVQRFLRTNDPRDRNAAERSLANKIARTPQVIGLELRDRDGKRLLWVGGPDSAKASVLRGGHVASVPPGGMLAGPIVADRGALFYESTAPITRSPGDTVATLAQFREVRSAQSAKLIAGLIGSHATFLIGDTTGVWNNLVTVVPGPQLNSRSPSVLSYTASDGSARLGSWAVVRQAPWIVWVDIRTSSILAPARRFLGVMALAGLLILILGAIGAWLIGRQITTPLHDLALAAKDISDGDYTRRVVVSSEDELGVLAESFNDMARVIEDSHRELEGRMAATVQDLTRQRKLEDQLVQAQKMEAVGQLAGGVAHDFNNLLTVIMSYSSMLLTDMGANDTTRGDIQEISDAAQRAATLTRQLLAFSRKQVLQIRAVNVNAVVVDVERMLRRLIGEDILLTTHLDPDLALINADPGQLEQVLINLAVNARDAMPGGGDLTITTDNADLFEEHSERHLGAAPGKYVMLAVTDTGSGMTKEVQQRLFEPFYTTKGVGKGTGLGLATVHGIVKQCGGDVYVYSEIGHGTTFKVYFPRLAKADPIATIPEHRAITPSGTETVLLAEDDEAIRTLGARVLGALGYNVLVARTGGEALRIVAEYKGKIDLIATDVVMPEMNGSQLVERVLEARPGIRVLFMSGYTDDEVMRRGVIDGQTAFLQKPFTPDLLAHRVREVLDVP
jgi:signal transduction histidine kinase/CheY-like chemotaxis protein